MYKGTKVPFLFVYIFNGKLHDFYGIIGAMELNTEKKFAAGFSILSNAVIIILKLAAGFISGSISIISEAVRSLSDMLASVLTYFSVVRSSEPADKEHPFGHARYEDMSGFIEGILIIFASVFIFTEAGKKLFFHTTADFEPALGIYVMLFAVAANFAVSSYLFKVAKKSDSIALLADAEHLRTDIYSSFGVLLGLVLIKLTGISILDPVIALIVAVLILKTGISITKTALNNLLDGSLPESDIQVIEKIINDFKDKGVINFKKIKSRQVGAYKYIEITLIFPPDLTILKCHSICDEIEKKLETELGNTMAVIHAEPDCRECARSGK